MFPDVRLLIAATLASVLALICGFGLFAAFRVSHDPLTRLPPATAALQLVADKSARLPVAFAPAESFERRFEIAAPTEPVAAAPQTTAAIGVDKPDDATTRPSDGTPPAANSAPAVSSPETATADAGHEGGTAEGSEPPAGNGEIADAQKAAAETAPADPMPMPTEQKAAGETAPADSAHAIVEPVANLVAPKPDEKAGKASDENRTWHIGAGAPRRTYATTRASARATPAQAGEQNGSFAQGSIPSATQPLKQPAPARTARVRARTQPSKLEPNAGIGGPFVSAPNQQ